LVLVVAVEHILQLAPMDQIQFFHQSLQQVVAVAPQMQITDAMVVQVVADLEVLQQFAPTEMGTHHQFPHLKEIMAETVGQI
jgi:hypothetical protein